MSDKVKSPAAPSWLLQLRQDVSDQLNRTELAQTEQQPQLEEEIRKLDEQVRGYSLTLANPSLSMLVRQQIETDYDGTVLTRKNDVESLLAERNARQKGADTIISEEQVLTRLQHLADVLANNNPTLGNLELSLHIDKI